MVDDPSTTNRRVLLRASALAVAVSTAGCTVTIAGHEFGVGDDGDDERAETTTFGYGGTETGATTAATTAVTSTRRSTETTDSGSETTTTEAETATTTSATTQTTEPATTSATTQTTEPTTTSETTSTDPADEYGEQRYGEYGYGGVAP